MIGRVPVRKCSDAPLSAPASASFAEPLLPLEDGFLDLVGAFEAAFLDV